MRHQFVRIHDGEPLWLELGIGLSVPSVDASDFECSGDERHTAILSRGGEEVRSWEQGQDWYEWVDGETGDSAEELHASDFLLGDKLWIGVTS